MITSVLSVKLQSNDPKSTRSLRSGANISASKIGTIAPDVEFVGAKKVTAEKVGEFGNGSLPGDIWWETSVIVKEYTGTPKNGWVAERHAGKDLLTVTQDDGGIEPPPPPVEEEEFAQSFTLTNPDGKRALYQFVRIL